MAITEQAVRTWEMQREEGYREPVPAMTHAERDALVALWSASTTSEADRGLLRALETKLRYRVAREIGNLS